MVLKKSIKSAAVFAMVCIIAIGGIVNTVKASESGQTHITYEVSESAAFPLTVTAEGKGYVQHEGEKISGTTAEFLLKVDEDQVFGIHPDTGETVEEILLNGENITAQLQNHQLTVHGAEKAQTLKVTFSTTASEIETEPNPEESSAPTADSGEAPKPGGGSQTPVTGDSSLILTYLSISTASLLGIVIFVFMKREQKKRGV